MIDRIGISSTTASSTVAAASNMGDFVGGLFSLFLQQLTHYGVVITDAMTSIRTLLVQNLIVGTSDHPNGITIYDDATGMPYCVKMRNGEMIYLSGECAIVGMPPAATSTPATTVSEQTDVVPNPAPEPPPVTEEATTSPAAAVSSGSDTSAVADPVPQPQETEAPEAGESSVDEVPPAQEPGTEDTIPPSADGINSTTPPENPVIESVTPRTDGLTDF
jgi:hypothetical protein